MSIGVDSCRLVQIRVDLFGFIPLFIRIDSETFGLVRKRSDLCGFVRIGSDCCPLFEYVLLYLYSAFQYCAHNVLIINYYE